MIIKDEEVASHVYDIQYNIKQKHAKITEQLNATSIRIL